jgi:hypothetical protein
VLAFYHAVGVQFVEEKHGSGRRGRPNGA